MRKMTCPVCNDYMYPVDRKIDLLPRNDGLTVQVKCEGCGLAKDAIFSFLRFGSEPLTQEEIAAFYDAAKERKNLWAKMKGK